MTLTLPDSFFRDADNPMWVFDDKTLQVLDVNKAACKKYGYTRREFLRLNVLQLRPLEEHEPFKSRKQLGSRVWKHLTKSGELLFIRRSEFNFELDGKAVTLTMVIDVSQEVRLEREQMELLQRYQVLTEAANDLLWDWDLRTNRVHLNEALITQYGYTRDDLVHPISWWSDKIHPDDYAIAAWSIQEAVKERRRYWTAEYRFKKADGSYVLVLDRGILHADENDKPIRMVGAIVDLTTRRAAEDDRNQLFRLSLDSMLFLDERGVISQANQAFYKLLGLEAMEVEGHTLSEFLPQVDAERLQVEIANTLKHGGQANFSSALKAPACEGRTISWGLITNDARSRLFLVGRDITETIGAQRELEAALERSQLLAIEAQMARKAQTEFLQNMSHELRTPMNGMLGTAQLLAASAHDERQKTLATILVRSGESLLQILNDILDFSKIESGKITLEHTSFQLNESVQTVYDLFELSAKHKGLAFTMAIAPEARVAVLGDPFRLRQIVSNLLGNAIKFTDTGAISVVLEVEKNEADAVHAIIRVRDTGIGVPDEMRERIFDRFVQVDSSITRRHGGTGLGLAIAKTMVELMGGSLVLESALGKGSTFTARIPFDLSDHHTEVEPAPHVMAYSHKTGARVLIAEDVEVNAMILSAWLEERGFECVTVSNGKEAIEVLAKEPFDGAFLDLHMPDASGYDVVTALRKSEDGEQKRMPVVAVTASVSSEERKRCSDQGFDEYIPKPILVSDLDRVVARLF